MQVRLSEHKDLEKIMSIFDEAKKFIASYGSDQALPILAGFRRYPEPLLRAARYRCADSVARFGRGAHHRPARSRLK